jgi:diguanylate cyclase (GGDEF)-like protein
LEIAKYRKDFLVYVVDDEESITGVLKEALGDAGYQVETFPSADLAFERVKTNPPHVVMSDIRMPGMTGIELLENIRMITQDIQFIIMTSHASLETALDAMRLGAYDYIHKPFEQLDDVIKTIDRTIEKLYLQYQNEQLLEELAEKNKTLSGMNVKISQEKEEVIKINNLMAVMTKAKSVDSVIDTYLDHVSQLIGNKPVIYLSYMSAYVSLAVTHSAQINKENLKNIGVSLKDLNPKEYIEKLSKPMELQGLQTLMKDYFQISDYLAIPIEEDVAVTGIVVAFDPMKDVSIRRLFDSFTQIFKVSFSNMKMQKRIHDMAIKDPLTGLFNRRYFNQKLEDELSRSRRTKMPVSLIYMDIDHFKKYNDQNGHPVGDVLLKMFAQVLNKTSRKNDIPCRIGGEEFVIILPHTDKMGAAIKAEKLRRVLESTPFPHGETQPLGKVTASMGVSEYPSHCHDVEGLVRAADEALYQVKSATRNKVCLATVPEGFKQDFEALKVQPYDDPPTGRREK